MSLSNENNILSAIGTRTILNLFSNVRLQLLYTTILFLSREAFRRTVPRLNDLHSIHHYINLTWFIIPVGLFIISLVLPFTLFVQTDNAEKYPFYYHACFFYTLAAFIELLSEPFYLLATVTLNYHINIYIEMFASTLVYKNGECALYYYGFGYIIYSLSITLSYYIYFITCKTEERIRLFIISSFKDLIIKPTHPYTDPKLSNETKTFFSQGILMKFLTVGERYIISLFNFISYKDQAIFDIINNLGSLLPRLIFSTLEESAYVYFQQTLSRTKDEHIQDDQWQEEQLSSPSGQKTIKLNALTFYNYLLRFVTIISLLVITFGISYSPTLLYIYGGSNLIEDSGPTLLRLYCIYGIIIANCLNMLLRIITNIYYVNQYFDWTIQWSKPFQFSYYYVLILVFSLFICYYTEKCSSQSVQHPLSNKREALRLKNLLPSMLCKLVISSKAISCAPITFNRVIQTLLDEKTPPIS
ncbi:unnamed protein product [Rotaria sp. Silwood2]|nr:unnamed protein product [Rotaria sp. Silwood2]